jgi:hypothetical protein
MGDNPNPRVILALAAEDDDEFIWEQLQTIQADMFAAGPVSIQFAYFGREGVLQTTRPFISTRWAATVDDMVDLMDHARANCVCGCFVQANDILEQALQETRQGPVQAVVIVGDRFYGDLDAAIATAEQLRAAGTRLFLFQRDPHRDGSPEFKELAEVTGGAHVPFNPHVERLAKRLPGLLEGVARFAIGGTTALKALEAQGDESAAQLLEQIAAGQITQD